MYHSISPIALPVLCLCYCCCEIRTVYVRDCHPPPLPPQIPGVSDVYIEHSVQATVAQYAPSGYYIASGGKHAWQAGREISVHMLKFIIHWLV